jgi:protein TonB
VETKKPPEKPEPLPEKNEPEEVSPEEDPAPPPPPPQQDPAPGEAGPEGELSGGPVAGGDLAALAGGDVEFAWYRSSVTAALHSNWRRPVLSGLRDELAVTVVFDILRDGTVVRLRIESSSGIPSLDRSALRAVSDASPLPALPSKWRGQSLEALFVFRLHPEDF